MILEPFYPKEWVDSTYGINWEDWREKGKRGVIFDIDNTIRVFSYKSNLWKSTLEKDVPNLATRINAVVNNIGIDKSYFDTFMGNN